MESHYIILADEKTKSIPKHKKTAQVIAGALMTAATLSGTLYVEPIIKLMETDITGSWIASLTTPTIGKVLVIIVGDGLGFVPQNVYFASQISSKIRKLVDKFPDHKVVVLSAAVILALMGDMMPLVVSLSSGATLPMTLLAVVGTYPLNFYKALNILLQDIPAINSKISRYLADINYARKECCGGVSPEEKAARAAILYSRETHATFKRKIKADWLFLIRQLANHDEINVTGIKEPIELLAKQDQPAYTESNSAKVGRISFQMLLNMGISLVTGTLFLTLYNAFHDRWRLEEEAVPLTSAIGSVQAWLLFSLANHFGEEIFDAFRALLFREPLPILAAHLRPKTTALVGGIATVGAGVSYYSVVYSFIKNYEGPYKDTMKWLVLGFTAIYHLYGGLKLYDNGLELVLSKDEVAKILYQAKRLSKEIEDMTDEDMEAYFKKLPASVKEHYELNKESLIDHSSSDSSQVVTDTIASLEDPSASEDSRVSVAESLLSPTDAQDRLNALADVDDEPEAEDTPKKSFWSYWCCLHSRTPKKEMPTPEVIAAFEPAKPVKNAY